MKSSGGQTHHVTANMTKPVLCPINPVLCRSFGVERGMSRPFLMLQLPQEKKMDKSPFAKVYKAEIVREDATPREFTVLQKDWAATSYFSF